MASSSKHTGPHDDCTTEGLHEHDQPDQNTIVEYMYRDASNYKQTGHTVFSGPPTDLLIQRLYDACEDENHRFNPDQVGIGNLRELIGGSYDDDHDLHEILNVVSTGDAATEAMTFEEFVHACESVDEWWLTTMQGEIDTSPHVQVTGDPVSGFTARGPYPNKAAALVPRAFDPPRPLWAMHLLPAPDDADPIRVQIREFLAEYKEALQFPAGDVRTGYLLGLCSDAVALLKKVR
jgi:hypothetical protein